MLLIEYKDIQRGDELIVPHGGDKLLYVKAMSKNSKSWTCSIRIEEHHNRYMNYSWTEKMYEPDVSKHNGKYYLESYRQTVLVKRDTDY